MSRKRNRLNSFVAPKPCPALIKALVPVNRVVCLAGIPILREVPLLGCVPGIRGLADVVRLDFPAEDEARLHQCVVDGRGAFLAPNHPEFFTDWMLDKEIMTRATPLAASWATHYVVNGMGALMQWFWLKNNLIAQIPGEGGAAGKAFSIDWVRQGHGVLLHPEGNVGWHADTIAPLFPGVAEMALAAARAASIPTSAAAQAPQQRISIVPIVWRLRFLRDEAKRLQREMDYVATKLKLETPRGADLAQRVHHAYHTLLQRDAQTWQLTLPPGSFKLQQHALLGALSERLERLAPAGEPVEGTDLVARARAQLRIAQRWLRAQPSDANTTEVRKLVNDLQRQLRFVPGLYPRPELTQEDIAENIKRLRNDYCVGSVRDAIHRFLPRPAGSRVAHIRVAQPINVSGKESEDALMAELHTAMQTQLDALRQQFRSLRSYANPFDAAA